MGIEKWSTVAGSNNLATPEGWPEGQAPSTVNDCARNMMANIREWYEDAEWLKLGVNGTANGFSISFISTTVFHFVGTDRRELVPVDRRIQAGVGTGIIEGLVSSATMSASDTVVTVSWNDGGELDQSLSYISLGILTNPIGTQAQMEAATDNTTYVSPGRVHHHPGVAKARALIRMASGTPSLGNSYGVDSIADTNVGRVTITLETSYSTSDYAVISTVDLGADGDHIGTGIMSRTPASFELRMIRTSGNTLTDSYSAVSVVTLGDFA